MKNEISQDPLHRPSQSRFETHCLIVSSTLLVLSTGAYFVASNNAAADDRVATQATEADYTTTLANHIRDYYFSVPGASMDVAVGSFTVDRKGYTSDITIIQAPARTARAIRPAEKAVFVAIRNAAPVPLPPAGLKLPARFTVTFDSTTKAKPFVCTVKGNGTAVASQGNAL